MSGETSRRALLGALATAPVVAGSIALLPAPAEAMPVEQHEDADWHDGIKLGTELSLHATARAWIGLWQEIGNSFGLVDGTVRLGVDALVDDLPLLPGLPPHLRLYSHEHHDGATKALEVLLDAVPGLRKVVSEIAGEKMLAARREG